MASRLGATATLLAALLSLVVAPSPQPSLLGSLAGFLTNGESDIKDWAGAMLGESANADGGAAECSLVNLPDLVHDVSSVCCGRGGCAGFLATKPTKCTKLCADTAVPFFRACKAVLGTLSTGSAEQALVARLKSYVTSSCAATWGVEQKCAAKCAGYDKTASPVCGGDGISYESLCTAKCNGVQVAHVGLCRCKAAGLHKQPGVKSAATCPLVYQPVCGADRKTYANRCQAQCNGVFQFAASTDCARLYGSAGSAATVKLPTCQAALVNAWVSCFVPVNTVGGFELPTKYPSTCAAACRPNMQLAASCLNANLDAIKYVIKALLLAHLGASLGEKTYESFILNANNFASLCNADNTKVSGAPEPPPPLIIGFPPVATAVSVSCDAQFRNTKVAKPTFVVHYRDGKTADLKAICPKNRVFDYGRRGYIGTVKGAHASALVALQRAHALLTGCQPPTKSCALPKNAPRCKPAAVAACRAKYTKYLNVAQARVSGATDRHADCQCTCAGYSCGNGPGTTNNYRGPKNSAQCAQMICGGWGFSQCLWKGTLVTSATWASRVLKARKCAADKRYWPFVPNKACPKATPHCAGSQGFCYQNYVTLHNPQLQNLCDSSLSPPTIDGVPQQRKSNSLLSCGKLSWKHILKKSAGLATGCSSASIAGHDGFSWSGVTVAACAAKACAAGYNTFNFEETTLVGNARTRTGVCWPKKCKYVQGKPQLLSHTRFGPRDVFALSSVATGAAPPPPPPSPPPPAPLNCRGLWGPFSACSKSCGGGRMRRTYYISRRAQFGGTVCTIINGYVETMPCGDAVCPDPGQWHTGAGSKGGGHG